MLRIADGGDEAVTEKGICFDTEMVRAILDGRKGQTRRAIVPQPHTRAGYLLGDDSWMVKAAKRNLLMVRMHDDFAELCPYGQVGRRLYVKEAIRRHGTQPPTATYVADLSPVLGTRPPESYCGRAVWQWPRSNVLSGRFMPRWAARLFLDVSEVRVQRVQGITEADARAEGVVPSRLYSDAMRAAHGYSEYICAYHDLWDRLNAVRGYSWASAPWLWCISFRRVEGA